MFTKKPQNVSRVRRIATQPNSYITRKDICCGFSDCAPCAPLRELDVDGAKAYLSSGSLVMIPDTNIVLHNTNVLEDPRITNIVFLTTVIGEVQNRNKAIYARLLTLINDPDKHCYVFANDRHEQTHCIHEKDETPNDFNDRCIRVASRWYARHALDAFGPAAAPRVVLVSHDKGLKAKLAEAQAREKGEPLPNFIAATLAECVQLCVSAECDLLEKIQYTVPEGMKESAFTHRLFEPHIDAEVAESAVASGTLFKGKLKVSETSCFFGEVRGKFAGHSFERIIIPGRANLNRAIHEDIVAVQLLPVEEWRGAKNAPPLEAGCSEEDAIARGYSPTGKVVSILLMRRRPFCGSLDVEDMKKIQGGGGGGGSSSVLFQPKDNRIPRIRITSRHLADLRDKRLLVVLDEWPEYSSFPVGHYVEVLGRIGDRDTEAAVILLEHDIPHSDFSEAVYDCLPKGTWSVSAEEAAKRLDLRDLCVVSVDPLGCRDIDDALHCRRLANGNLEVGVHIADVTHFLPEDCAMDEEAAKRSTSVYLEDRRINMLPQLLTENLCSLVEAEDRYAFSILWEFDSDLNVVNDWFGKSIIRSRGALYYGDAQAMMDDPANNSDIAVSLRHLMRLSQHFKGLRERDGALFLASQEFKFKMDNDHLNPTDMQTYQTFEANSMIEEWMLYANAAAAAKVFSTYPRWTLLRRHQRPAEGAFDTLNEALEAKLHVRLDDTSSLSLNQSLNRCEDKEDPYFNKLVRILTTRCLRQAQYFSSGDVPKDEFYHFGLAMPIYTHFTSPIRRYADVIVHRQLAAALGIMGVSEQHMDSEKMAAVADNINYRHEQAQRAGRDSQNLFTGFYLRTFADGKIPVEDGYVVRSTETHVFVLVPKYGQESKIPKERLTRVPALLEKVRVLIELKQEGDVLRTKLVFSIVGCMKEGEEGGEPIPEEDTMEPTLVKPSDLLPPEEQPTLEDATAAAGGVDEVAQPPTKKARVE